MEELKSKIIRVGTIVFGVFVLFIVIGSIDKVKASYDTYLQKGIISFSGRNIVVDWSPGDTGGSQCEGSGVWSCGCQCVDEGQEQNLIPYVEVETVNGSIYTPYQKFTNNTMHWDTDNERFTTPIYGGYTVNANLSDSSSFRARFCLTMQNLTDPGESKTQCGNWSLLGCVMCGCLSNGCEANTCQGSTCNNGCNANAPGTKICAGTNPVGWHDTSSCSLITGWACDADNFNQALEIHIYKDGQAGSGAAGLGGYIANVPREAAVGAQCGGNSVHGFSIPYPDAWKDGAAHTIYTYAINVGGGNNNPLLSGSPKSTSVACSPACPTYSAPANLTPTGTVNPGNRTISWTFTGGANLALLRIDDQNNGWVPNNGLGCNQPQNTGDVCVDNLNTNSYTYQFQVGHTYNIWVHQGTTTCPAGVAASSLVAVLNRPPTGSINPVPCDNDPNGNGAVATVTGTAVDPDLMPTRVRCNQNGGAMTEVITDANGNFSYTYPSLFGTNTISCWALDSTNNAVTVSLGSRSYTKINEATYSAASRCDIYYDYFVNNTPMGWGVASENKYGYLDGNCAAANYNVSPMNYNYHTGTCTASTITWKARVKGVMADGGKVNLRVVGHNDKYTAVFTGPCNTPSLTSVVGQEAFTSTKDYACSIPQGIKLEPNSLDFDYTDVSFAGTPENVNATIQCTLNNEITDITTNTVVVTKGELEACFNVDLVNQSNPYNTYTVSDNYLVSRCDGNVNFHIDDYLFNGENWGPMNGNLSLYYNPAQSNTSERFEYSGDVIVNPPPGFEEFIFPTF